MHCLELMELPTMSLALVGAILERFLCMGAGPLLDLPHCLILVQAGLYPLRIHYRYVLHIYLRDSSEFIVLYMCFSPKLSPLLPPLLLIFQPVFAFSWVLYTPNICP
jgi:hypothetical protein